jgi:hypothetical protein
MSIWMQCQSFVFEWKTQYFGARMFVGAENLYMQPTHNLTIPFGSTELSIVVYSTSYPYCLKITLLGSVLFFAFVSFTIYILCILC